MFSLLRSRAAGNKGGSCWGGAGNGDFPAYTSGDLGAAGRTGRIFLLRFSPVTLSQEEMRPQRGCPGVSAYMERAGSLNR